MANVYVVEGDITSFEADALLVAANPHGKWQGAIDKAIRKGWGTEFHDQLLASWKRNNFDATGDAVLTQANGRKVMFVCDDMDNLLPFPTVLYPGLDAIALAGMKNVVMPVVRTGVVVRHYGVKLHEVERELVSALKAYRQPLEITLVVYNDRDQADRLRALIASS